MWRIIERLIGGSPAPISASSSARPAVPFSTSPSVYFSEFVEIAPPVFHPLRGLREEKPPASPPARSVARPAARPPREAR
jgi:hypothetical protein